MIRINMSWIFNYSGSLYMFVAIHEFVFSVTGSYGFA